MQDIALPAAYECLISNDVRELTRDLNIMAKSGWKLASAYSRQDQDETVWHFFIIERIPVRHRAR